MKLVIIAAVTPDGTIGHQGRLPWHLSEDLRRFKAVTMGHTLVMGRKTYDSIGKPLPGRRNIVLTRGHAIPGVECFSSLDAALKACPDNATVFVIGGAEVYRQALPLADQLLLTHVHQNITGDTKFPDFDRSRWREVSRTSGVECDFVELLPNR
ncbi:MAG: dihydrofolate reductase [Verrucomicrobia bacterium]|nr:dihydrofolate reductase [Verrucomicrobiota bacterium]